MNDRGKALRHFVRVSASCGLLIGCGSAEPVSRASTSAPPQPSVATVPSPPALPPGTHPSTCPNPQYDVLAVTGHIKPFFTSIDGQAFFVMNSLDMRPTTKLNAQVLRSLDGISQPTMGNVGICGITPEKSIRCLDSRVAMGIGPEKLLPHVEIRNAIDLVEGTYHACARLEGGSVTCWGSNADGQIGNGKMTNNLALAEPPTPVIGLSGVRKLVAGDYHSCALLEDRTVRCWGHNKEAQCSGVRRGPCAKAVTLTDVHDAIDLALSELGSCALMENGTVKCWGLPTAPAAKGKVADVVGIQDAKRLFGGGNLFCAELGDGSTYCFGDIPGPPRKLEGTFKDLTSIWLKGRDVCAVRQDKTPVCGQIGSDRFLRLQEICLR